MLRPMGLNLSPRRCCVVVRLVALLALLGLSGCLASVPALPAPAPLDDGWTVTAVRVEPFAHAIDEQGSITLQLCSQGKACGAGPLATLVGIDEPVHWSQRHLDFGDPAALFWRVAVRAEWSGLNSVSGLRLSVFATSSCGIACLETRLVNETVGGRAALTGDAPASAVLEEFDVYLQPGESGIRVALDIDAGYPGTGPTELRYHLQGAVTAFRGAGDPIVLS